MNRRRSSLLVAATLFLGGCSDAVVDAWCDLRLPPSSLEVRTRMEPTKLRHARSRADLGEQLSRRTRVEQGDGVVGLTTAKLVQDIRTHLDSVPVGSSICARPSVTVELRAARVVVDVASDLRPGSCLYEAVMEHEQRHVQAYAAHLHVVAAEVRAELARRYPDGSVLRARSHQELMQLQSREIKVGLAPFVARALHRVDERQAEIDTPEEYARLARVCGD